jgi:hypothetical protein
MEVHSNKMLIIKHQLKCLLSEKFKLSKFLWMMLKVFIFNYLAGLFTCDNIIIEEGPKNYEFDCAGILDKKNK